MRPGRRFRGASPHGTTLGFSQGVFTVLVLFLAAAGGIAWVSAGIVTRDQWPIRWLEVNGAFQRVSAEQMRASLGPLTGGSFFTVDLREIQATALRNAWVSTARVEKRWPDTVTVTLEEYVPLAHWNEGQLISTEGQVFSAPGAEEIQGLPRLAGPADRCEEVLTQWNQFSTMLQALGLEVENLALSARGSWAMQLDNGTQVQLGRDDPDERLQRLIGSWEALIAERELPPALVDLRYTNGFAVDWPDPAAELLVNATP